MYGDMKAAFLQGAGVDPERMKAVLLTIVFAAIFIVAGWIGQQLAEAYGDGLLDKSDLFQALIAICVLLLVIFSFLAWL
ncbi:conjugal transfer protein [Paracidovorax avenae]|uniref:DUF3262 family protein n=1 Tax=Paracidovorax avenae TaxID=80867 RepID=UPI000D2242DD|nr:DUF3262 family protein [Paracidovorax avenae]AVS67402.1 conjugal transfer protein [Paracidovorax avenae]